MENTKNRFYYSHSLVYGWTVYDRNIQSPAYEACAEFLPHRVEHDTHITESPVLLTEYQAMSLCRSLNVANKRKIRAEAQA